MLKYIQNYINTVCLNSTFQKDEKNNTLSPREEKTDKTPSVTPAQKQKVTTYKVYELTFFCYFFLKLGLKIQRAVSLPQYLPKICIGQILELEY